MRSFYRCVILMMAPMVLVQTSAAQQLSARMNDVLAQEGQIEDFVFSGSPSPIFVTITADSRKDRQAILAACQPILEEKWQIVENQYGYNEALLKNKNALATAIGMLTKARRSQQGLDDLQSLYWQFENDYSGSGQMLGCMLGKALVLAGGKTAKDSVNSVPDVAGLGSNSQQVLLHIRKSRFTDTEARRDQRAILRQCEEVLDASFAQHVNVGQDPSVAASSADYLLNGAVGRLERARWTGSSKELDDELRSLEVWVQNNPNLRNQLDLCFLRAAKSLVSESNPIEPSSPGQSPGKPSTAAISFDAEYKAFYDQNRPNESASVNDNYIFSGRLVGNGLLMLDKYKSGMTNDEYDIRKSGLIALFESLATECLNCKFEFESNTVVNEDKNEIVALKFSTEDVSKIELSKTEKLLLKIKTVAIMGTGCVSASVRDQRFDKDNNYRHTAEFVLKNSCAKAQIVKIDVDGPMMLTWPALFNLGRWPSTANADVPAGIPFKPIISLAEGGDYMVPANGEHVISNFPIATIQPQNAELKVWLASCDAYSEAGFQQVIFRPNSPFSVDSRAFCGPSLHKGT